MATSNGQLVLIGGGGHALVVFEAAHLAGWQVLGFVDDDPRASLAEHLPHLGPVDSIGLHLGGRRRTIVAIGDIARRQALLGQVAGPPASVVHPRAIVSISATIGEGTFIGASAIVQGRAVLGEHVIVNTGAIIEHDGRIGPNVHLAPRTAVAGNVTIGESTLIGIGAVIAPGVRIGAGCTVGAGACVIEDVPDGATVVGVPARPIQARSVR